MADQRTEWQQFKKKFPDFEKNRAIKKDLGPLIDAYAKKAKVLKATFPPARMSRELSHKALQRIGLMMDGYLNLAKKIAESKAPKDVLTMSEVTQFKNEVRDAGLDFQTLTPIIDGMTSIEKNL